ncbi:WecB/TagA/CpsF family glycosyltransferase [Jannaschia sp. CCS1]|uniref:WecB/TagA/CpsF family glycosyltransferase n=1 Tax=Jannaschia sp. (strain CCS1) TaxID=290400 RepID=UPI000682F04A|nr:WecB/TagA/CpsF family glycosyltransferase [Jannaschia sp. CCS1]
MMTWSPAEGDLPLVKVTVPNRAAFLDDLRAHLVAGSGFAVATLNLDHVVKLHRDLTFRAAYAAHDYVTADGRPIVWLSRLAGSPVELVTGSDLMEPLFALAAETKTPVAFFGSSQEVLDTAKAQLEARFEGLNIEAAIAPPMGFDPMGPDADMRIAELDQSGARLCLLAFGAPKQEIFAARATAALPHMGFVSIGASLDFIAGAQKRAPRLVRVLAAEWLWRMLSNPRRMVSRYMACLGILPTLTGEALRLRWRASEEETPRDDV